MYSVFNPFPVSLCSFVCASLLSFTSLHLILSLYVEEVSESKFKISIKIYIFENFDLSNPTSLLFLSLPLPECTHFFSYLYTSLSLFPMSPSNMRSTPTHGCLVFSPIAAVTGPLNP